MQLRFSLEKKMFFLSASKLKAIALKLDTWILENDKKDKVLSKIDKSKRECLMKYFTERLISSMLKSLHLKLHAAGSQESKHCKLGRKLERILVENLTKDSLENDT